MSLLPSALKSVIASEPNGPATDPLMSRLLGVWLSFAIPCVEKDTLPFTPAGAVIVKPLTVLGVAKLPVPHVGFVQTTVVPPPRTVAFQLRLCVSRDPTKSEAVGGVAAITPLNPDMVIVLGEKKMLQLSNGSNVRVYVHVGGPTEVAVHW